MDKNNRVTRLVFATLLLVTLAGSANAYVDPGTGSFAIQVIIASTLGAVWAMKSFWANLMLRAQMIVGRKRAGKSEVLDA